MSLFGFEIGDELEHLIAPIGSSEINVENLEEALEADETGRGAVGARSRSITHRTRVTCARYKMSLRLRFPTVGARAGVGNRRSSTEHSQKMLLRPRAESI